MAGKLKGVEDKLVVTEQDLKDKDQKLKDTEKKLDGSENKVMSMEDSLNAIRKELQGVKDEYDQLKTRIRGILVLHCARIAPIKRPEKIDDNDLLAVQLTKKLKAVTDKNLFVDRNCICIFESR